MPVCIAMPSREPVFHSAEAVLSRIATCIRARAESSSAHNLPVALRLGERCFTLYSRFPIGVFHGEFSRSLPPSVRPLGNSVLGAREKKHDDDRTENAGPAAADAGNR